MSEDVERLVAEIDAELKKLAKADPRTIREIVESALSREFQTGKTAAVERRIEEQHSRLNQLQQERNEREREIAEVKDEIERLETTLQRAKDKQTDELDEAVKAVSRIPDEKLTEDNPAIENWASKIGVSPAVLITEVKERR